MTVPALLGVYDRGVDGGLLADTFDVAVPNAVHPAHGGAQFAEPGPAGFALPKQVPHPRLALLLVLSLILLAQPLDVPGDRLECGVRDAPVQQERGGAEQAVAAADAVVEEREGTARGHGGHPEADLAQLHGHLVDIDAVQAVARPFSL